MPGMAIAIAAAVAGGVWLSLMDARAQAPVPMVAIITNRLTTEIHWKMQYLITPAVRGEGGIQCVTGATEDGYYDEGSTQIWVAVPGAYQGFSGWTGQIQTTNNPLVLEVREALTNLVANFVPLKTLRGTPHAWLAQYGFDPEAGDTVRTNHYELWQHYQWDTHPLNPSGYFHLRVAPGRLELHNTSPQVEYAVEHAPAVQGPWKVWTNFMGQPGIMALPLERTGYYRVQGRRVQE